MAEYLSRKYVGVDIDTFLDLAAVAGKLTPDAILGEPVCADADDDKFMSAALTGQAGVVISGDKHLIDVDGYRGIQSMKPSAFEKEYL